MLKAVGFTGGSSPECLPDTDLFLKPVRVRADGRPAVWYARGPARYQSPQGGSDFRSRIDRAPDRHASRLSRSKENLLPCRNDRS